MDNDMQVGTVERSDAEWQALLTPEQYKVLRKHATERAGASPLNHEGGAGYSVAPGAARRCSRQTPSSRAVPAGRVSGSRSKERSPRQPTGRGS